jgi:hypothetical protein
VVEYEMAKRMGRRGLVVAPLIVLVAAAGGPGWALSAAIGVTAAVANLLFAGKLLGMLAESNPQLLVVGGLVALFTGLLVITGLGLALWNVELVFLPVMGIALVGTHLALVLWEAAGARATDETPDVEKADEKVRARS